MKIRCIRALLSFLAIAVVLTACPAPPADGGKIVVATDATWPPMESVNERNEIVGYDIDLMKEVAKRGGFTVEFRKVPWKGIFDGLQKNEYDAIISSVTVTAERLKTVDFSTPYINAGQVIVVRSGTDGIQTPEDLSGRKVGAQNGTTGSQAVAKIRNARMVTYPEIAPAFEDLARGRIDAVVCDTPIAANYAYRVDAQRGKFVIVGEPFTQEYYAICVKKGNTKALVMINRGLSKVLRDRAFLTTLERKWLR